MHDPHRAPLPPRLTLLATLCVLITTVGCEPGDQRPEAPAEPPATPTLDTVAVIHNDLLYFVQEVKRGPDGLLVVMKAAPTEVLLLNEAGDLVGTVGRPTGVVAADARDGRVVAFDWNGQTARTLRPASPPTPASEADMDALWERVEARVRRDSDEDYMSYARQSVEVWDRTVPRPFYSAVISDGSETLIGHYAHRSTDIVEWSLLDRNGKTVGAFTLDEGIRLYLAPGQGSPRRGPRLDGRGAPARSADSRRNVERA